MTELKPYNKCKLSKIRREKWNPKGATALLKSAIIKQDRDLGTCQWAQGSFYFHCQNVSRLPRPCFPEIFRDQTCYRSSRRPTLDLLLQIFDNGSWKRTEFWIKVHQWWVIMNRSWEDPWPRVLLYEHLLTAILYGSLPFLFAIIFVFIFVNIAICIQRYRVWWAHRSFVQEKVCSRSILDFN